MGKKKKKSSILNPQSPILKWIYPPNNWKSKWNRTFVYGYSDTRATLYVLPDEHLIPERVKIFPNGNFAQVIRLPSIINNIKLIQILGKKKKVVSRKIYIATDNRQWTADNRKWKTADNRKWKTTDNRNKKRKLKLKSTVFRGQLSVVIDPGHGGKEHGTHSPKGIPEKKFNLQVAKSLFKELKKITKKVYLTRTKDKFLSLKKRINFAKKKKCNLLISIHHNALPDSDDPMKHRGIGIYFTHEKSKKLAYDLLENISKESGLRKYGVYKRDFALTRLKFCTSVLIECGFLTHPLEAEYVTKRKIQEKIVKGIASAISKNLEP